MDEEDDTTEEENERQQQAAVETKNEGRTGEGVRQAGELNKVVDNKASALRSTSPPPLPPLSFTEVSVGVDSRATATLSVTSPPPYTGNLGANNSGDRKGKREAKKDTGVSPPVIGGEGGGEGKPLARCQLRGEGRRANRGYLPVCRASDPICPILRIPPEEGHVFKTKQRAPTLITCEVLVPTPLPQLQPTSPLEAADSMVSSTLDDHSHGNNTNSSRRRRSRSCRGSSSANNSGSRGLQTPTSLPPPSPSSLEKKHQQQQQLKMLPTSLSSELLPPLTPTAPISDLSAGEHNISNNYDTNEEDREKGRGKVVGIDCCGIGSKDGTTATVASTAAAGEGQPETLEDQGLLGNGSDGEAEGLEVRLGVGVDVESDGEGGQRGGAGGSLGRGGDASRSPSGRDRRAGAFGSEREEVEEIIGTQVGERSIEEKYRVSVDEMVDY